MIVPSSSAVPGPGTVAAHMAVMQTPSLLFVEGFQLGLGVVPPVWTLSVEVGYYLILPFIAATYFRHPLAGLAVAGAVTISWTLLGHNADWAADLLGLDLSPAAEARIDTFYASQFPNWIFAIACGMTGAWAYVRLRDRLLRERHSDVAIAATGLSTLCFLIIAYIAGSDAINDPSSFEALFGNQSILVTLGSPVALMVLLVCFALMPDLLQRPCTAEPIRWLGDVSYGIFLIHFAVLWLLREESSLPTDGGVGPTLAWCAIVFPASIGYAYLSARFLERPVRRWAHRFGRRAEEESALVAIGAEGKAAKA